MIAAAALSVMTLSCLGSGLWGLHLLGWRSQGAERIGVALYLGFGILGWWLFVLGMTNVFNAYAIFLGLMPGLIGLRHLPRPNWTNPENRSVSSVLLWGLAACLVLSAVFDAVEALPPPIDADSLAYHFNTAKTWIRLGHVEIEPRAVDGAAPMLPQLTYAAALSLGGEQAMTGWCTLTGWWSVIMVYGLARRWTGPVWALSAAALFMTWPAIVYGAGSGQVEVRLAGLSMAALSTYLELRRLRDDRLAVLLGMFCGFYAASKFPGLLFSAVTGLILLVDRRKFKTAFAFGAAATAAGFQWYALIWDVTGDPFFPMLFNFITYPPTTPWNAAQDQFMRSNFFAGEMVLERSIWSWISYPWIATFSPPVAMESGRTGLGPAMMMTAPFALAGFWRMKTHRPEWLLVVAVAAGTAALWFFLGPSQRVRHMIPLAAPLFVVMLSAAGHAFADRAGKRIVGIGLASVLMMQISAQIVFTKKYFSYLLQNESRDVYYNKNINFYKPVQFINNNLSPRNKILIPFRELLYLIDIPTFYANTTIQALVELRPDSKDPDRFLGQLHDQGITHLLVSTGAPGLAVGRAENALNRLSAALLDRGDAEILHRITSSAIASRTSASLDQGFTSDTDILIVKLRPDS